MKVKQLLFFVVFSLFFISKASSWSPVERNDVEGFSEETKTNDVIIEPENTEIDELEEESELEKNVLDIVEAEEEEKEKSESDVDEEMIRKAEKIADKDLLNGLNAILKNNETLQDVFRAENIYESP